MCGRFYVAITENELLDVVKEVEKDMRDRYRGLTLKTFGEIYPGDIVPVFVGANNGKPMKWGFGSIAGKLVINARSETAHEKPMFKEAMGKRRCLIPASAYYEWSPKRDGKPKTKYTFHRPNEMLYLAGCYREEKDSPLPTFVILTRNAVDDLLAIHDRMPVLIPKAKIGDWFAGKDILSDALTEVEYHEAAGDGYQMKMEF
ncbi:MAG: SOS response-associated peptidase [Clostridium sp.]|jgi:putative SOS response-associated peptidase YedK|nr:SOS response-associated peptidase [Clostridium sp.]